MTKSTWPKFVPIPDRVGSRLWKDAQGYPICALAHAHCVFRGHETINTILEIQSRRPPRFGGAGRDMVDVRFEKVGSYSCAEGQE